MAINYPTSLDNFTNPSATSSLDSPSHSLQHSDANDALEALEEKVGIGASPAGSATAGQVLTAQGGGTALWTTPALVHLNTTTFSAVASQDVTCFSADYEDYLVQIFLTTSSAAASTLRVQLGLTGSFDTGNNYRSASGHVSVGNADSSYAQNAVASWQIVNSIDTGKPAKMDLNIAKPFLALNTHFTGLYFGRTAASQMAGHVGGIHDLASSYNQIKIFPASGTITGSVSVYGLRF